MRKTLHILRLFWSTAMAAEMEYRLNFLLTIITCLGQTFGTILTIPLFYKGNRALGGYPLEAALIVTGIYILLDGLASTVMRPNLSRIITQVRNGTLDFVLLKPIDAQFWLSLRNCSPWGIPNIVAGLAVIFHNGHKLSLSTTAYFLGLPALLLGMTMLYSLWFMLGTLSIWFVKVPNITHVLTQLLEAGRFPITAFPMAYRLFFTLVVPVAFLTTFPADMMTGQHHFGAEFGAGGLLLLSISFAVAATLLAGSRIFWRFALRYYTSASS